jgi:hypothetical protein
MSRQTKLVYRGRLLTIVGCRQLSATLTFLWPWLAVVIVFATLGWAALTAPPGALASPQHAGDAALATPAGVEGQANLGTVGVSVVGFWAVPAVPYLLGRLFGDQERIAEEAPE